MSQQGPGGYGGGGPYGPPGGGYPPGGQGGPPGYGGPPGGGYPPGYGGPQAPPPYAQQPGYGPGPTGAAPPAPAKKNNTLLFLGLGCGVLVLLGIGFGAWAYFGVYRPAKQAYDGLQTAATVVPGIASALNPSGVTSPNCAKAAACCRAILERTSGHNTTGNCDAFSLLSDEVCATQYDTFKRQAKLVGVTCE